jgi:hypothetical protein
MSSRLLSSATTLLLVLLALVSLVTPTQGLYFHVQEGGRRCFLEEVPEVSRFAFFAAYRMHAHAGILFGGAICSSGAQRAESGRRYRDATGCS